MSNQTQQAMKRRKLNKYQIIYDGQRQRDSGGKYAYITAQSETEAKYIASSLYNLPIRSLLQVIKVPD